MLLPTTRPRAITSPQPPPTPPPLDEELPLPRWPSINLGLKATRKKSLPGSESPPVSEQEFRNLPVCIQRKYFSSLERLHIAYSAAANSSTSPPPASPQNSSRTTAKSPEFWESQHNRQQSTKFPRSATPVGQPILVDGHVQRRTSLRVKRPQTANVFGDSPNDSRLDAQWFTSLPEKVRQQHFSVEDQDLLASGVDHWFISNGQGSGRNSRASSRRLSQTFISADSQQEDMDGQLKRAPSQMRGGFKRAFSSFHVPHSSVSSNAPTISVAPLVHRRDRSQAGTLIGLHRPSVDTTATAIDPDALYYQSPEARFKLRQYLASPQKFDEALTYGFPSTPTTGSPNTIDEDKDSRKHPSSSTDHVSLLDKEDDMSHGTVGTSDGETDSPATPADADWSWRTSKYNRLSIFGGIDTDSMPALDLKFQPESFGLPLKPTKERTLPPIYACSTNSLSTACLPSPGLLSPLASPLMNREMTLRMTLTRPDLRATDDELYGWQGQRDSSQIKRNESRLGTHEDSLTLAELQSMDDSREKVAKGSGKLLRRMMKRMKRT